MVSFRAGMIARSAMSDTTPPNTIRALPGAFVITGEDMTIVTGYAMQAGVGAFALAGQSADLKPPAPTSSFLHKGTTSNGDPFADRTFDIDIGTAAAGRLVVVALMVQATDVTSLVIDPLGTPVPMTVDRVLYVADTGDAGTMGIYSAVYAGGGMTKFKVNGSNAYQEVAITVWVGSGLISNLKKQFTSAVGGGGAAVCALTSVAAGDFVVAVSGYPSANSLFAGSTELPTSVHNMDIVGPRATSAEWIPIAGPHAPFNIIPGTPTAAAVVAVSYA